VSSSGAIHSQHYLREAGRQQRPQRSEMLPQLHQLRHGNVAPFQIEELIRSSIAVQSDPPAVSTDVQSHLCAVIVGLGGGDVRRIGHFLPCKAAESIANQCAADLQLSLIINVLELAPAAVVLDVVGAAWLNAGGAGFEDVSNSRPGKALVLADVAQLDQVTGGGAGHEHCLPIGQLAHPFSTRS
jgi:hypothetical protein